MPAKATPKNLNTTAAQEDRARAERKRELSAMPLNELLTEATDAELEAIYGALRDSIDRAYEAVVKVKREHSLDEWTDRREGDLTRLTTAIENLALSVANGGAGVTTEIGRLRVMTSNDLDAAVRSQIDSAADASILPLVSHRAPERALLDRMHREIERKRGEALLTPREVKAVRTGRMRVGQATLERAGAESLEEYLAMSEEHER